MLLRQLKYFVAVVERGSFTEAAADCDISQSAVSQQIKTLENELGVKLMERRNRGFSLTPAGELFYGRGKKLLREAEELCRDAVAAALGGSRRLRVGYLKCFGGDELRLAVAEFSEKHPDISIETIGGSHEELYDLLRFGGVDLAMSDQRRAFSEEYVNFHLSHCLCCAEFSGRSELAACSGHVGLEALSKVPCILVASKEQRDNETYFYQNTLGVGSSFVFAESIEEGRMMAAGNLGFLLVEYGERRPARDASLLRLPIYSGGAPLRRNYCAFWRKSAEKPVSAEFAETLYEIFRVG